jgi:hypothetical protein
MKNSVGAVALIGAAFIATAFVGIIQRVNASTPQPNVVRMVRVGEGRWEGTACWPTDGGAGPRCYKTGMTAWEPPHVDAPEESPKFRDAGR